jgi:3-oxoadipate enol-lactonase
LASGADPARIEGVTIHVRQAGDVTSRALVLLHGSGRASRMWGQVLEDLSAEWHVLAPDLPGFGQSQGPFTVAGAAHAISEIAAVQTAPVHLCGMSLGGVIAVRAAAELGHQVASLTVTGTPVVPRRDAPSALHRYRSLPGPLLRMFSDVAGRRDWLRILDELEATDLRDYLPLVTAPTLVVCGSRDWRAVPAACELAKGIPGGRVRIAPHQGENWPATAPGLFSRIVTEFIAETGDPVLAGPDGAEAAAGAAAS